MVAYERSGQRVLLGNLQMASNAIHVVSLFREPLAVAPTVRFTCAVMMWSICYSDTFFPPGRDIADYVMCAKCEACGKLGSKAKM